MDKKIRFYALENAVKFKGTANPGAVIGKVLRDNPKLKKDMKTLSKKIQDIVKEVNELHLTKQVEEFSKLKPKKHEKEVKKKKDLPALKKAVTGKVVTRIPPEPSKYNHIGHALSFLINYVYAKKYKGKCIIRFEDTNPEKSTQEFVDAMLEDCVNYLGIKADKILYVSDELPLLYKKAEELIKKKKAYVCICDREMMQKHRETGDSCLCVQKNDVKTNLAEWERMLKGEYDEGQAILRLSGDMTSKNYVMRDPVIFRINKTKHYRQKNKYCVWPLYDFENAVLDSVHGVTHVLRSSEFGSMRVELQNYIKDLLNLKKQVIKQYGRFNIKGATTKGREIRELIKKGKVSGWDDPSLVTLKALRRRGILKETFYELIYEVGLSPNTAKNIDWSLIFSINRSLLDANVNRYFFIENPIKITIDNAPNLKPELKLHPDYPKRGKRVFKTNDKFYITKTDKKNLKGLIRLMDCLNFTVKGKKFTYHSTEHKHYKKSGEMIIHWLPYTKDLIKVEIRMPDNKIKKGYGEPLLKKLKESDIVQFTRFGFCRLDKKSKDKLVFWFTNK